mmetsp:Transcript_22560/g.37238  ORF Transcript_22560/g.37238 Transcript_22560/m.37238 type:complete len:158 (-) Transcript_22560:15-488(-)
MFLIANLMNGVFSSDPTAGGGDATTAGGGDVMFASPSERLQLTSTKCGLQGTRNTRALLSKEWTKEELNDRLFATTELCRPAKQPVGDIGDEKLYRGLRSEDDVAAYALKNAAIGILLFRCLLQMMQVKIKCKLRAVARQLGSTDQSILLHALLTAF